MLFGFLLMVILGLEGFSDGLMLVLVSLCGLIWMMIIVEMVVASSTFLNTEFYRHFQQVKNLRLQIL